MTKNSKRPVGRPPKIKPAPEYSTGKGTNTDYFRKLNPSPEPTTDNKFELAKISCSPKTSKTVVPGRSPNNGMPGKNVEIDSKGKVKQCPKT